MKNTLCPFSKPIIGGWCQCKLANLEERCAGKMICRQSDQYLGGCLQLVNIFKEKSRFVLGISQQQNELTHMQLMKIRCGGLQGMHRVLTENKPQSQQQLPDVLETIELARKRYGQVVDFPFSEIIKDIQGFSHRRKKTDSSKTDNPPQFQ